MFRGTQNVQALANSMTPQDPSFGIDFSTNGRNPNPPERLGWGNDAPPLRDFALVAIAQHATTTLSRTPGSTSGYRRMRNWMRWWRISSPSVARKTSTSRRWS